MPQTEWGAHQSTIQRISVAVGGSRFFFVSRAHDKNPSPKQQGKEGIKNPFLLCSVSVEHASYHGRCSARSVPVPCRGNENVGSDQNQPHQTRGMCGMLTQEHHRICQREGKLKPLKTLDNTRDFHIPMFDKTNVDITNQASRCV